MNKKFKDRLVGGLIGGSGPLIFLPIFAYAVDPRVVTAGWLIYLTFELLGIVMLSIAVYFYLKKLSVN